MAFLDFFTGPTQRSVVSAALADWNVSKVTNMNYMFAYCSSLTPLTSWDVSNVKYMNNMFSGCSKFTDLTALANWNVSNVTDMRGMFNGCFNLQKVGIPSIANGGQNLVNRASSSGLVTYLPTIISDDFTMGPYPCAVTRAVSATMTTIADSGFTVFALLIRSL